MSTTPSATESTPSTMDASTDCTSSFDQLRAAFNQETDSLPPRISTPQYPSVEIESSSRPSSDSAAYKSLSTETKQYPLREVKTADMIISPEAASKVDTASTDISCLAHIETFAFQSQAQASTMQSDDKSKIDSSGTHALLHEYEDERESTDSEEHDETNVEKVSTIASVDNLNVDVLQQLVDNVSNIAASDEILKDNAFKLTTQYNAKSEDAVDASDGGVDNVEEVEQLSETILKVKNDAENGNSENSNVMFDMVNARELQAPQTDGDVDGIVDDEVVQNNIDESKDLEDTVNIDDEDFVSDQGQVVMVRTDSETESYSSNGTSEDTPSMAVSEDTSTDTSTEIPISSHTVDMGSVCIATVVATSMEPTETKRDEENQVNTIAPRFLGTNSAPYDCNSLSVDANKTGLVNTVRHKVPKVLSFLAWVGRVLRFSPRALIRIKNAFHNVLGCEGTLQKLARRIGHYGVRGMKAIVQMGLLLVKAAMAIQSLMRRRILPVVAYWYCMVASSARGLAKRTPLTLDVGLFSITVCVRPHRLPSPYFMHDRICLTRAGNEY